MTRPEKVSNLPLMLSPCARGRWNLPVWVLAVILVLAVNTGARSGEVGTRIDSRVEAMMREGHFPGVAVAVMRYGEEVYVGSYGFANLADSVAVSTHTVFELASLTKQMTALAVMTLVDAGQLSLKDHLVDYVDGAPEEWKPITIGEPLCHMAGLAHHFEKRVEGAYLTENSREQMLASAMSTPMNSKPGTDWKYSDEGYFLLGIVIEKVTGESYADYMRRTYFEPLGLVQTHLLDQNRIVPHLARGYAWKNGKLERNRRVWNFAVSSHFGVMSSLKDMIRWEAELSHPNLIDSQAMRATWEIQRTFDTGASCDTWGYGRGWFVDVVDGHTILSHGGYAGTAYLRFVDSGLSVIVLSNREDAPNELSPTDMAWEIAHVVDASIPAAGYHCWE